MILNRLRNTSYNIIILTNRHLQTVEVSTYTAESNKTLTGDKGVSRMLLYFILKHFIDLIKILQSRRTR